MGARSAFFRTKLRMAFRGSVVRSALTHTHSKSQLCVKYFVRGSLLLLTSRVLYRFPASPCSRFSGYRFDVNDGEVMFIFE